MKKIYLFLLFSIFYISNAQQETLKVKELHQVNTYNGGLVQKTVFDQSGNNITVGYSNGQFNYNGEIINTVGRDDLFICKKNNDTNEKVWLKTLDAGLDGTIRPYSVKSVDNAIYVTAYFDGRISINNKDYLSNIQNSGILIKIDEQGNFMWAHVLPIGFEGNQNIEKLNNILFANFSNGTYKINDVSGEAILFNNLGFRASNIKIFNNEIFVIGNASKDLIINSLEIKQGQTFVGKLDLDFNLKSALRIKNNDVAPASTKIIDLNIVDENNMYVLVTNNRKTPLVANADNGFSTVGDIRTTASVPNDFHYWIGNFKTDFSSSNWFFGNGYLNSFSAEFFPLKNNMALFTASQ